MEAWRTEGGECLLILVHPPSIKQGVECCGRGASNLATSTTLIRTFELSNFALADFEGRCVLVVRQAIHIL